nr:hypothetical protein [Myrmica rubra virus 6]
MKSGKLSPTFPQKSVGLYVSAVSNKYSTLGFLEPHSAFGFMTYTGSTIGGFSGTPYVVGNAVYGMHLGSGNENVGLDSAYILMVLRSMEESSEDYFIEQMKRGVKFSYRQTPGDPSNYYLRAGHTYHTVDRETVQTLIGGNADIEYEGESVVLQPVVASTRIPVPAPVVKRPLAERLRESLYVGESDSPPPPTVPQPMPRAFVPPVQEEPAPAEPLLQNITLPESKNWVTAPAQDPGPVRAQPLAPNPNIIPSLRLESTYPTSMGYTPSPPSMPAQPNDLLNGIQNSFRELGATIAHQIRSELRRSRTSSTKMSQRLRHKKRQNRSPSSSRANSPKPSKH